MIPVVVLHALSRAIVMEAVWRQSAEAIAADVGMKCDWPEGHCVEASVALRDELAQHLPECAPVYVWGDFIAGLPPHTSPVGHAWVEVGDGYILDITINQFFKGTGRLPLVLPGTYVSSLYVAEERPAWV